MLNLCDTALQPGLHTHLLNHIPRYFLECWLRHATLEFLIQHDSLAMVLQLCSHTVGLVLVPSATLHYLIPHWCQQIVVIQESAPSKDK